MSEEIPEQVEIEPGRFVQVLGPVEFTPVGYQGAAQHTYTTACDGFHEPGQCPRTEQAGGHA